MHYYKTILRLNGNTLNEVVKTVTAPELLLLQFLHGVDACTRVQEIKNEKIDLYKHKEELRDKYQDGLRRKNQSIDSIFGALGTLPERLPEHLLQQLDIISEPMAIYDPEAEMNVVKDVAKSGKGAVKDQTVVDNENRVISSEEVNIADIME